MKKRKFIQLISHQDDLYGLDYQGIVWWFEPMTETWQKLDSGKS